MLHLNMGIQLKLYVTDGQEHFFDNVIECYAQSIILK